MSVATESQGWSAETKKLVFATVANNCETAAQRALFEAVCVSSGLDPLRREVYPVVRKGRLSIQTGIDGYLKLANRTRELDGIEVLFYGPDGVGTEVWLDAEPPVACLVRVYRKGCSRPFAASCRFDAYSQRNEMWRNFGETMLAKCTTTLALRRAFADVIGGIASADELDQAEIAAPELVGQGLPGRELDLAPVMAAPAPAPAPRATARGLVRNAAQGAQPQGAQPRRAGPREAEPREVEPREAPHLPAADRPWFDGAPVIDAQLDGDPPAIATLRQVAADAGLTRVGWAALGIQFGGVVPTNKALTIAKALNSEKISHLNSGHDSRGERLLVHDGDSLEVEVPETPIADALVDW